jgi:hypothetical protein
MTAHDAAGRALCERVVMTAPDTGRPPARRERTGEFDAWLVWNT